MSKDERRRMLAEEDGVTKKVTEVTTEVITKTSSSSNEENSSVAEDPFDSDKEFLSEVKKDSSSDEAFSSVTKMCSEDLRAKAAELIARAEALEKEEEERRRLEEEAKARAEAEAKAKAELERASQYRKVYFIHRFDGRLDYDHPIYDPLVARRFDPNYETIPSLTEEGRYVRPLTLEEASGHF